MRFPAKQRTQPKVNLTALIDIVFLLLIFFLLASNFVEQQGVPVSVPETQAEGTNLLPEIKINIDKDSRVYFNGVQVNGEILGKLLKQQLPKTPGQHIAIKADRRVSYDTVVQVIDIAKSAGAKGFLLITQPAIKE